MDYKEKCKLIYKYRNDSYMVVLNDEYRYDGSLVVEADNALELEAKLNKVERVDRTYARDRLGRFAPKGMGSGVAAAVVSVGGKNVISGTEAARDYKVTGFDKSVQKAYDKARKAEPAYHFPDNSSDFENIDSKILLRRTVDLLQQNGFAVGNVDCTICAERPKLKDYIEPMRECLAATLGIAVDDVSVKATTTEKLGFVGHEEGIAAYAVALIEKI